MTALYVLAFVAVWCVIAVVLAIAVGRAFRGGGEQIDEDDSDAAQSIAAHPHCLDI